MSIKKELGEKIKRVRKKNKLTQEQLAEKINISPNNLSAIELGTYFVKAETLEKILKALNITAEDLFANDHIKDEKTLIKEINKNLKTLENNKTKLEYIYKIVKFLAVE